MYTSLGEYNKRQWCIVVLIILYEIFWGFKLVVNILESRDKKGWVVFLAIGHEGKREFVIKLQRDIVDRKCRS